MKKLSFFTIICAFAAVACGCASSTAVRTRDADLVAKYQQTLEESLRNGCGLRSRFQGVLPLRRAGSRQ